MARARILPLAIVLAGLAISQAAISAEPVKKPYVAPRGFYANFFAPKMTTNLTGQVAAAAAYTDPSANPWTRDDKTVHRIEQSAIYAAKSSVKKYAIAAFRLDAWSIPLVGGGGAGVDALKTESGGTRLRFGISHLTPRADVMIPSARGNVVFSADVRGRVSTSFESHAYNFSLGASYDTPEHSGTFTLSRRF